MKQEWLSKFWDIDQNSGEILNAQFDVIGSYKRLFARAEIEAVEAEAKYWHVL
jgi:hypothetical protein